MSEYEDLLIKVTKLEVLKESVQEIKSDLKLMWAEIKSKVSLKLFIPAMALLIICMGGILGFQGMQVWKISETSKNTALVQKDFNHVQETLRDIKAALEKLPGKLNGSTP
ncbi:hypothetical protein KAR91_34095 [Candidatus Pacearchaeota archaeon]|nr:hypothetical protein [Candidatus Pacearchaeota archaeon]